MKKSFFLRHALFLASLFYKIGREKVKEKQKVILFFFFLCPSFLLLICTK